MIEAHPVDVVVNHPRVVDLGRTPAEQRRVDAFARDLARWLYGEPRDDLGPLARVVVVVAHRELKDPKVLCSGRPLLAVESAARATEAMWPLLRGPLEDEEAPEEEPPPTGGGANGAGAGGGMDLPGASASGAGDDSGAGDGDGDEDSGDGAGSAEGDDSDDGDGDGDGDGDEQRDGNDPDPTAEALLASIAEQPTLDDPELEQLAGRLREALGGEPRDETDLGAAAGRTLADAASAALDGALETDAVARRLEQFLPGVGWSWAPGRLHQTMLERLDGLAELVSRLEHLDELALALGRLEGTEGKGGMDHGGSEEVIGVHLGGDVAHALPSELALLGDPDTEDLFYQRLIERRLLALELEGAGLDGAGSGDRRGPVIACIDTSGSMEGAPELAAKALVLALCRRVLPQGRVVHLILFSGRDDRVELRLRRGAGGLESLLEFLTLSFHGGTDFDAPLLRALELLREQALHRADVLVVTDGLARAASSVIDAVHRARRDQGVRVWSVVLGRNDPHGVRPFSDHVWRFDPHDAARASGLLSHLDRR